MMWFPTGAEFDAAIEDINYEMSYILNLVKQCRFGIQI